MKKSNMRKLCTWLITGLIPCLNFAADNYFTGTGDWTDTARWSLSHIPTVSELAWIDGTAAMDSSQTIGGMNIRGTLDISGVSTIYSSTGQVYIGYSGSDGVLTQTDGEFTSTENFYLGEYRTGSATFTDTDVILGKFILGHGAVGNYTQQGGTVRLQGSHFVIGHVGSGKGTMSITDTSLTSIPKISIGFTTEGNFYATNSIIDCNGFTIADLANTKGYAELVGCSIVDCSSFIMGANAGAQGTAYVSESNITSDYVSVGFGTGGSGTLVITNSEIKTATEFSVGYNSSGVVSNFGGRVETPELLVGHQVGSQGSLYIDDSEIDTPVVYIGQDAGSQGSMHIENGEISVPTINVGSTANATGSLTLANGTLEATSVLSCGNYGVGSLSNIAATIKTPGLYVGHSGNDADGYMYCAPGSSNIMSSIMQVGRYGKGTVDCYGSIDVNATSLGLFIGNLEFAEGTFNVYSGSTLNVSNQIVMGYTKGTGTINQYGGNINVVGKMHVAGYNGAYSTAEGYCNLYGGTMTVSDIFYVGRYGQGELTVDGGNAVFPESTYGVTIGTFSGSTGTIYLVSGSLAVGKFRPYQGYERFYFDGGTLKALSSKTDFMTGLDLVEVREGGAVIDTAGENITIAQSIAHDSRGGEPAKDGGLTKLGDGTLTMTGTLGFTGDLGADGGTLNLSSATYSLASGSGIWGSGTLIPPSGSLSVSSTGFVAAGSTNGVGTLTFNGSLTVDGEVRVKISDNGTTCGSLSMGSNALTYTAGSEVVIENPEDLDEGTSYTIVTGSNITGLPDASNLPDNWKLSTRGDKIRVIYNSGTVILVR